MTASLGGHAPQRRVTRDLDELAIHLDFAALFLDPFTVALAALKARLDLERLSRCVLMPAIHVLPDYAKLA